MAENTKIEWAHHTFNPWIGCTKVSPACDHCYAEKERASTVLGVKWGVNMPRHRTSDENWKKPIRWNAAAEKRGVRESVFCASLGDWADNAVPAQWRFDLADLILKTPWLDWLLLTKRIGNAAEMLAAMFPGGIQENVWIGATITSQEEADRDIPKLLAVPAAKRFLSMEPLLGPVDLTVYHDWLGRCEGGMWCPDCPEHGVGVDPAEHRHCFGEVEDVAPYEGIDWVIVGGESGPDARPMHPDWARDLRNQCLAVGVPFLFKQWGEWAPAGPTKSVGCEVDCEEVVTPDGAGWSDYPPAGSFTMRRIGKKAAGRTLDGRTWDGVPA